MEEEEEKIEVCLLLLFELLYALKKFEDLQELLLLIALVFSLSEKIKSAVI